jgi:4-carboxymuconolactone decarboxylase
MSSEESRYDRGLGSMRSIFGPGIESALKDLAAISPDLARCLVEFPFADIYPRPGLDLKTREMLTVAALTVLGYPQAELKEHIQGAMNVGCTREEILEIILKWPCTPVSLPRWKPSRQRRLCSASGGVRPR